MIIVECMKLSLDFTLPFIFYTVQQIKVNSTRRTSLSSSPVSSLHIHLGLWSHSPSRSCHGWPAMAMAWWLDWRESLLLASTARNNNGIWISLQASKQRAKAVVATARNLVKIPSALHCLESQAYRHGDTGNIMPSTARNCIPLLSVCFS